ncbi:penicillin acylase family protein [Aureispira sp. CCB-E]|uniref:penicillin acylase family protein n=1 Tax=Aureispira sp. CCB-E TaxID=3051121 RepID=UPI002868AE18|nr:penicillin acylase family protein [Aureispira sp. CCB-E]WMX15142.1 penicillin acylase family protein [Aureispira sp. CCB-E]
MRIACTLLLCGLTILSFGQTVAPVDLNNITIARDEWGVPHIFTQTDVEAAYGLAWAHCEDNFEQVQEPFLAAKGIFGAVLGKEGALFDAISFLIKSREVVEEKYETTFSPKFKQMLTAYASAVNRYAELHPKEIRHKKLFPITPKDIAVAYNISTSLISNIQFNLGRLFENNLEPITSSNKKNLSAGSNGIAIAPHKTQEGKTFLVSNSHQPLRSYLSWYEVHIHTEEGWNFTGATFCGGITPFVGTNEHLGWTHCVNYNDYSDVFELKMHPKEKLKYQLDGKWLDLEERIWKATVKVWIFKFGIRKKFYWSKYGPVVKNKTGFYALRFPSNMVIGAPEQWYHMNKATNLDEFKAALNLQQQPSISTTYADKEGNILFVDNGLFPYRNPNYNWKNIVPGDTSATLWAPNFMPMDSILTVENPPSGYVFHMNGTGFNSTADADNPNPADYNPTMGYITGNLPRQLRFKDLIAQYDQLSYEDFKRIKYDYKHRFPLYTRTIQNWDLIRHLSPKKYPKIADIIAVFSKWDGNADVHNKQAAIFLLSTIYISDYRSERGLSDIPGTMEEATFADALLYAKKYLLKHFKSLEIELGDLQKHVRGTKVEPVGGVGESIAAMYTVPWKKGMRQSDLGESFILFATYNKNGVEKIESINCYGASNRPESPHYNDQMDLYLQQKTKVMSLNKTTILETAKKIYHPQ